MKRFEEKYVPIPEAGCWAWIAHVDPSGYGKFKINGEMKLAHRVSYELYTGTIPDGMFVLHKCDNRICVNPAHLFLGTHQDNMDDMKNKGRSSRESRNKGSSNGRAKLTESDVSEIRKRYEDGCATQHELSVQYGVSRSTVSYICSGQRWKQ